MKRKWAYAPIWVNIVYIILEQIDYKIFLPISSFLMNWRFELLDKHCSCSQCIKRKQERQGKDERNHA